VSGVLLAGRGFGIWGSSQHTGDGAFLADQVGFGAASEVCVQHGVKAAGLVLIAVHAVFDVFGGVAREVVCETCKLQSWGLAAS
jgi:hypothetical protein